MRHVGQAHVPIVVGLRIVLVVHHDQSHVTESAVSAYEHKLWCGRSRRRVNVVTTERALYAVSLPVRIASATNSFKFRRNQRYCKF